jgi:hypothetical protein
MTSRILTISAAVAMGVVLSAASPSAQTNGWLERAAYAGDDYRASYSAAQREAYDNGYRDGLKRGEDAARARRAFNVEIERDYRSAERGYNRNLGDRNRYRDTYRGGFAQGYRDGYDRYGRAGDGRWNNGPFRNGDFRNWRTGDAGYGAFQNGISDGYDKGLDDLQDRRRPDVTRHKWYRNGDHDFDGKYGLSKDAYRIQYRRGFEEGYNRAFRGARRF